MQNDIYDMDKKMFLTNGSLSTPTRTSSQSSYTSTTSGYSNNSNTSTISLQQYDDRTYDVTPYTSFYNNATPPSAYSPGGYIQKSNMNLTNGAVAGGYTSQLVILEQPAEKFRFRYKSEMHGTHGSLNGSRSEKNKKTFPEVELKNFNGVGVIRCSLYQTTDKPSPHSHQLVVRKDDSDERDPHDLRVSPEKGYIARFENMGIIHTAKKNICEELYSKKKQKLKFESGCERLSQRQEKILRDEAENEAKNMNLNQVRLCFEAFEIVNEGTWKRICEPVFSKPINNRKSALTGELKICRMSTVVGSAAGDEDIILLVEKVSKKNIQVRFFEMIDEELVWEAYGNFNDADVHHQYAIVVRTPSYKNKDIDTNVNVLIELVRKSDDERSAPLGFRYKPRDIILSRKRRRTSYTSSTSSPVSSSELPKPITEGMQQQYMQQQFTPFQMAQPTQQQHQFDYQQQHHPQSISQEFNKDAQINALLNTDTMDDTFLHRSAPTKISTDFSYQLMFNGFVQKVRSDSEELKEIAFENDCLNDILTLQTDGDGSVVNRKRIQIKPRNLKTICKFISAINSCNQQTLEAKRNEIRNIFDEYMAASENGDTIIHEIVKQDDTSFAMPLLNVLSELKLTDLLSQTNNSGQTPLHIACLLDQNIYIRPLLTRNCDPNIQDKNGNTVLHIAVNENLTHCLNGFVSFNQNNKSATKLNANLANDQGLTPLHLAIRRNYLDIAEILLKKFDASAKIACSCDGNNALHLAVQHQNYKMVKVILDNSEVKLNSKNQSGHTAIDLANTLEGSVKQEILNLLSDREPSPTARSSSNETSPVPFENKTLNEDKDEDVDVSSSDDEDQKPNIFELEEQNREALIKRTLKIDEIQNSLAKLLTVDDKWKKLAAMLKQEHMLLLCNSAKSMLRHIIERIDEIGVLEVVEAIQTLNPEAVDAIVSPECLNKDSH